MTVENCTDCRARARRRATRSRAEAPAVADSIRRLVRALAGRVEADKDLLALAELYALSRDVDAALGQAARSAADFYSWSTVGKEVGLTRQGARQRWSTGDPT